MNLSGEAVRDAASFYKIPPERVIVLSDDVSLDVGTLRVRAKARQADKNGLKKHYLSSEQRGLPAREDRRRQKPRPDYDLQRVLGKFRRRIEGYRQGVRGRGERGCLHHRGGLCRCRAEIQRKTHLRELVLMKTQQ